MAQEHRVIGPPGTGKTSFIRSQIEHWVEGGEYRPADFALTSYTRASAAVLRGRIDVPPEQAATLHSLCWHALGRPELAEVGKNAAAWNAQTPYAEWHVGSQKATALDEQIDSWSGPNALGQYNLGRAMMLSPQHPMLASVKTFVERWEAWKYENDFMDFQDLIDRGRRDITACPGDPAVLICDEAQDFVPAQWELVRKWGDHTDRFIVAGDPAQSLYSFAGSRPDEFLSPLPEENIRHLKQSHRLPQRVQHHAEQVLSNHILKLPPREYAPRDEAGAVRYLPGGFYTAGTVLDDVAEQLERGRSCMLLTTCNYMTKMYVREMRERGMLFHNPYRVSAGQWNPLGGDRREGSTRTLDRLLTYLKAPWTPDEARSVIEMLGASVFARHGVRAKLMRGEIDLPVNEAGQTWVGSWSDLLTEEAFNAMLVQDTTWLVENCQSKLRKVLEYATGVYTRFGLETLLSRPRVIVGTVHSVKGGEADVVYVCPDVSWSAYKDMDDGGGGHDAMLRVAYVAMTRAREELVLCEGSTRYLWPW